VLVEVRGRVLAAPERLAAQHVACEVAGGRDAFDLELAEGAQPAGDRGRPVGIPDGNAAQLEANELLIPSNAHGLDGSTKEFKKHGAPGSIRGDT